MCGLQCHEHFLPANALPRSLKLLKLADYFSDIAQ
jgi:hypothetical protein